MKKGEVDGCQPSKDEMLITNGMVGGLLNACDSDPGCGKSDASDGWREEYRHQMVVAAVAPPEA